MRSIPRSKTEILARNPLLMVNGCNAFPELDTDAPLPLKTAYEKFLLLYNDAIKQAKPQDLVFGLNVDLSSEDKGLGGFYDAGFMPTNLFSRLAEDPQKHFAYWWPRDPFSTTGQYMRYQCSINLGYWPRILHQALCVKEPYWSKSFVCPPDLIKTQDDTSFPTTIWMHIFTSRQPEFSSSIPDCHVSLSAEFDREQMDPRHLEIIDSVYANKHWTKEQIAQHIKDWQERMTPKADCIHTPASYFSSLTPRFHFDGFKKTKKQEGMEEDELGIFKYTRSDCTVFGVPKSQQEPRRYLSPDSYNGIRGLTPAFSFSDDINDVTHQVYADTLMLGCISGMKGYCKLDSSNT